MFPWGGSPPPSDREATVQREIRLNGRLPQYSRPTPTNRPMAVQADDWASATAAVGVGDRQRQ